MAKIDEKMQMIGSAITSQAEQERASIIEKANTICTKAITDYKDQLLDKMYGEIQQKTRAVRQKAVRDRALAEQKSRREVHLRREELAATVFAAVRSRLLDYAGTEAYRTALLQDLRAAAERFRAISGVNPAGGVVLLREEDLSLAPQIRELLPGVEVQPSRAIRLGGFQLRADAQGLLLDETLDERLEAQRPWYLEQCGLRVTR